MGRTPLLGGDGSEAADTELSLRPGGNSSRARPVPASPQAFHSPAPSPKSPLGQHQPLTIFYGGRICVCDVTEVQARSIIAAAQRGTTGAEEMELAAAPAAAREEEEQVGAGVPPRRADAAPQQLGPGLSMKASLQRFLQKRKSRAVDSGTPYARPHDHLRPRYGHLQQQRQQLQLRRQASFLL
ncbi:hypothetical protein Taro_049883 [Colocasia esculenta]|uniref:Protein TIFY n=1 Tax=Colocasia esculenta TaxID=4460 RepID=A0A843XBY8_COLES|nr:hypothetical protein [Colocasia esculenta]